MLFRNVIAFVLPLKALMLIAAKPIKFVEVPLDGATVAHPFNVKYACKFFGTAFS